MCELVLAAACAVVAPALAVGTVSRLGPAAAIFEPAPIWRLVYVPILLLAVAGVAQLRQLHASLLDAGAVAARAAIHGGTFLVAAFLLRSGELVATRSGATLPDGIPPNLVDLVNGALQIGLFVVCIISAIEIALEVHRARSGDSKSSSASPSTPADSTPARHVNGA